MVKYFYFIDSKTKHYLNFNSDSYIFMILIISLYIYIYLFNLFYILNLIF